MKNICFESYRQSKRDKMLQAKPKPKQLDPTWYTDNIYSNRSEDLDEDYVPDCIKYGTYRKLRNIREQEEIFENDICGGEIMGRRVEGEGSPSGYGLHRSTSCREFKYPTKSQSCCFEGNVYEMGGERTSTDLPQPQPTHSILKKPTTSRTNVPKSYSFSATSRTTPFDVMDYELPPMGNVRREKQEAFRKSMANGGCYWSNSLDENALTRELHTCCSREHCTNAKCLLDEIYPGYPGYGGAGAGAVAVAGAGGVHSCRFYGSGAGGASIYGAGASGGSNRNLHTTDRWFDGGTGAGIGHHRMATGSATSRYSLLHHERGGEQPPTMTVCCCAVDDYCYHRQQQHHMLAATRSRSRLEHCPSHHPAAEEEEHLHCRAVAYDTDLDHFIRDERERLMMQDKFLDEDERYLMSAPPSNHLHYYRRPARSKSLLEVQPPSRFDEDTCSDTTEIDLEDFNIDLEKYWEELEKPPSPIDLDMQRNMHSNLKVKNVNVGCYNNGQPIDLHDREYERMMIKKSLLEGMPSPPHHADDTTSSPNVTQMHGGRGGGVGVGGGGIHPPPNNATADFHFFEQASSPLHQRAFNYGHKVYPAVDTLPSYKYNNFYEKDMVQTRQPTSSGHHTAVGGHSALSLINNIFSIYKPNKYSPLNCNQLNMGSKPDPIKKMNVPSTRRPLGAPHSEYMHSMKRPLIVSTEQPHFKIIPEKTGLKISPLYTYDDYGEKPLTRHKLTSTARPLMLPH